MSSLDLNRLIDKAASHCHEARKVFEQEYMAEFNAVGAWMGPLFTASMADPLRQHEPHQALALLLAGEALAIIEDTGYRFWSEDVGSSMQPWARNIWRFALAYPLGFLVSNQKIHSADPHRSWNPITQALPEFMVNNRLHITSSNRPLAGNAVSLALYYRLFGQSGAAMSGMTGLAVADAFSERPNRQNPIIQAARRALRKILRAHPELPMPYWWRLAIQKLVEPEPDMAIALATTLHRMGATPIVGDDRQDLVAEPAPTTPVMRTAASPRQAPPTAQPLLQPLTPPHDTPADCSVTEGLLPEPECPVTAVEREVVPDQADPTPELLLDSFFERLADEVRAGRQNVNCKGALLHIYRGHVWSVSPKIWTLLPVYFPGLAVTAEQLESMALNTGYLQRNPNSGEHIRRFAFKPAGTDRPIGKVTLVLLSAKALRCLFTSKELKALSDNPDLVPEA